MAAPSAEYFYRICKRVGSTGALWRRCRLALLSGKGMPFLDNLSRGNVRSIRTHVPYDVTCLVAARQERVKCDYGLNTCTCTYMIYIGCVDRAGWVRGSSVFTAWETPRSSSICQVELFSSSPRMLLRHSRPIAAAAATAAFMSGKYAKLEAETKAAPDDHGKRKQRFYKLPTDREPQRATPNAPYPDWDWNWDYRELTAKDIAKQLGHHWPITDYAEAIRQLYAAHSTKTLAAVDQLIEKCGDDLPALYRRAYREHAFGGAKVRHILLVRHGQYEEQRTLSKALENADEWQVRLEELTQRGPSFAVVNERQVLTPLGREQAAAAGERLAEMLRPALQASGREGDVRMHVSTLTRAKQTADIVASRLPAHVMRLSPDENLAEGCPPAHDMPTGWAEPDGVHYDGARIEAAFRRLFYRALPRKTEALAAALAVAHGEEERGDASGGGWPRAPESVATPPPRHEYEIVVCHMNVIRYFVMRALQLPPEAWLRMGGFNGSITHLRIATDGRVCLEAFGDAGHLSLEQTTFGRAQGWE